MPKLLIYGLGRSGTAVATRCQKHGIPFAFYDEHAAQTDEEHALAAGGIAVPTPAGEWETVIAAPGVPWDHPDLVQLRAAGAEVIGEVEWALRDVKTPVVGITGTAGKSSVTAWLTHVLISAGEHATAGGNIDPALSQVADDGGILVVELSSFQLERSPTLAPTIRVLLNLGEDHLDRHGTVTRYHELKLQLLQNLGPDDVVVYNADDPLLQNAVSTVPRAQRRAFSMERGADAYLDANNVVKLYGEALVHARDLPVPGRHQIANALAVAVAAGELGLDHDDIAHGLESFAGLPGRFTRIGERNGVTFFSDSIATRPLAVEAALRSAPGPIVWLAGGRSKGGDLTELHRVVQEKVALVVGFGESAAAFAAEFAGDTETIAVAGDTGEESIRAAVNAALAHFAVNHPSGSVVFAPLGTSFDQFPNYIARAETFERVVREVL